MTERTTHSSVTELAVLVRTAIYDLLFKASAETMLTIAADPKHLGARIAITAVPHTWGSAMTHHPHVHVIVPGGGLSPACPGEPAGGKRGTTREDARLSQIRRPIVPI